MIKWMVDLPQRANRKCSSLASSVCVLRSPFFLALPLVLTETHRDPDPHSADEVYGEWKRTGFLPCSAQCSIPSPTVLPCCLSFKTGTILYVLCMALCHDIVVKMLKCGEDKCFRIQNKLHNTDEWWMIYNQWYGSTQQTFVKTYQSYNSHATVMWFMLCTTIAFFHGSKRLINFQQTAHI